MKPYRNPKSNERGAILILAMLFAATLSALAYSSFSAVEANFAIARQDADALRAELAAQSGIEYGQFRLAIDSDWLGTDGLAIEYSDDTSFTCNIGSILGGTIGTVELDVTGESGDGYRELSSRISPIGGNWEGEIALAMLGGDDDVNGAYVCGDVLVTDDLNQVYDWEYDEEEVGSYVLQGPDSIEGTVMHCSWVNGTVYKFTNTDYVGWPADEVVLDSPHMMPQWDLDGYLEENVENPCNYHFYYNTNKIQYKTFYKPVVVINPPGKNIFIKDSRLYGGLIVWCPKDYDLRQGPRQTLKVKDSVIGSHCIGTRIGAIAPACEFHQISTNSGCGQYYSTLITGFSMVNLVKDMRNCYHEGMLYVVNRIKRIRSSDFYYNSYIYENLPDGITLENSMSGYTIASIGEDLD